MAETRREVTDGDGEAEEEGEEAAEAPAQPRESKKPVAIPVASSKDKGATDRGSVSSSRDTARKPLSTGLLPPPPSLASKSSSPLLVSATHCGPSPTPVPSPSPAATYRGGAPQYSSPVATPAPPAPTLSSGVNLFANDGSFMELFKKQMEAKAGESSSSAASSAGEGQKKAEKSPEAEKRRPISTVGKRRGGAKLALKTGIVTKKPKNEDDEVVSNKGEPWAQYMAEVKKYKAHQCSDDDKTRPLVK